MADVAVLVPVVDRPQNARPFMTSFRASEADANVYAVVHEGDDDTMQAWVEAGAFIFETTGTTFAQKINYGYAYTHEPWLFLVGDDVRFHPRWLTTALSVGGDRYDVVGTNDLGTLRVQMGQHATHMLVRRNYVDQVGASWDGPGVVCHEYSHWFVDDEIVAAAKQRDVWVSARSSIVEHLHPYFGKASMDDVYELGQANAHRDWVVFASRLRIYAL